MMHNSEEIQKLEHRFRMEEAKLAALMVERNNLDQEIGEIKGRMTALDNEKFKLLSGRCA